MATKRALSEAETLEMYRVALENAQAQSVIAALMAELGYDPAELEKGKTLLAEARTAYASNQTEDDETSAAYASFVSKKEALNTAYTLHRKKAKVIFRNDPLMLDKLALSGSTPKAFVKWLESLKKFYTTAAADTALQSKLARLKLTAEELTAGGAMLTDVEQARAVYLKEKGETQVATQTKDAALAKIDDWMSEFFAVARIALEDQPQLLEVLGKTVRS